MGRVKFEKEGIKKEWEVMEKRAKEAIRRIKKDIGKEEERKGEWWNNE